MTTTATTSRLMERLLSSVPAIAVSFSDKLSDAELARARADGLDVFELRIDRYASHDLATVRAEVQRFADVPTIATIRTADEGGLWSGTDADRVALFEEVIPFVDAIDIELASETILPTVVATAKAHAKAVIISNHNFEYTPAADELATMARRAKVLGADFVKLSTMARSTDDIRTLAAFTIENANLGLIVIAMGGHGTASRVFFPALGSRLTYAYTGAHPVSGQLTFDETFAQLRLFYPEFNERKITELEILEDA